MTTTPTPTLDHPVLAAVERLRGELSELAEAPVWSMSRSESARALVEVARLAAQVAALELRVAAQARDMVVEDLDGSTSTATWWAHATMSTRAAAHGRMTLASGLDRHRAMATALGAGEVMADQAGVIANALDALPDDVDPAITAKAETHLLDLAKNFDAKALRRLAKKVLTVVSPEAGEAHEAAVLAREERDAAAAARFTMTDDGHGKVHGRFTITTLQGAMPKKALLGLAAPKHQAATTGAAVLRPGPEKLGRAFGEYVERFPADGLPEAGGLAATVVVTLDLDALVATLDTGEVITAGEARRLACQTGIIPAVLGGQSQVLDLGRQTRFHTKAQRIALGLRDRGCTAEGCDWPPGLCHAHHDDPWHRGGHTDTRTGRLFCPRHHARAHDPAYETAKLPGGKVAFTRRE